MLQELLGLESVGSKFEKVRPGTRVEHDLMTIRFRDRDWLGGMEWLAEQNLSVGRRDCGCVLRR